MLFRDEEVGVMLANVERQISDLNKTKSFLSRIGDKLPIIGNIKRKAEREHGRWARGVKPKPLAWEHLFEVTPDQVLNVKNAEDAIISLN